MKTVEEYLRHAEECDRLAHSAVSAEQRVMIEDMAETWRTLASSRVKMLTNRLSAGAHPLQSEKQPAPATTKAIHHS